MSATATVWSEWDGGLASAGITTAAGLPSASEALAAALGRALSVDEGRLARELTAAYASEINVRVACVDGAWTRAVGRADCLGAPAARASRLASGCGVPLLSAE